MEEKNSFGKKLGKAWSGYSFIFVFIIILIAYALVTISTTGGFNFRHVSSIFAASNTVIIGTIALGMAFIIITGQIDLSVGSTLVVTTGVGCMVFNLTGSIILMILAAIAAGAICGLVNGLLVGLGKMPPFVVTLGTMLIYRSIALTLVRQIPAEITGSGSSKYELLRSSETIPTISEKYEMVRAFGNGKITLGSIEIPYIFILFLVLAVIMILVATKTRYGKSVYAVGSNEKSARLAGIKTTWIKISCFILIGVLTGIAGVLQICKIGNATPASTGQSYEMYAIAAVVLAGVNMAGGRGNMVGVIFGALSYTTISFVINNIGLSVDIQDCFQGLVLIVVILIQTAGPGIKEWFRLRKIRRENATKA